MSFKVGLTSKIWAEKSQIPVSYEAVTASTNSTAKDKVIAEQPITLYLTDHQTAGRGRGDHSWTDPENGGASLLSSWVFMMRNPPQPILSPAIGLAVWTALKASFPWLSLSLKAPNDIYLGDKKLAGLLIENVQQGSHHRLIVGLGINVWKSPAQVETSTDLAQSLGQDLTMDAWTHVLDRLLLEISLAISQTKESLSMIQRQGLCLGLNEFPLLSARYQKVDADGSLWQGEKKINWSEL